MGRITVTEEKVRETAEAINAEERKCAASVQQINDLITKQLKNAWNDSACDELVTKYTTKSQKDLEDLLMLLKEFSASLVRMADDVVELNNRLKGE